MPKTQIGKLQVMRYRSEFIIDVSPKAASQLLSDKIKHVKWNSNAKEIHTIESLDKDMEIRHIVSPGYLMGLVAARDFCNICGVTKIQQTGIYFAYYVSVDCRKCPPSKKYVRAHTYPSGTILYPIEGEPNKSRVVSITQFDAKVQPRSLAETLYPSLMALYSSCMKRGAQKLLE
ncbi:stAR-related lipid transfer protein 5-like [Saccoglossus kowalevskii]